MSIFNKSEWGKLHIAKFSNWTLTLQGDQHLLGWMMIFPPRKITGPFTLLTDQELVELKRICIIVENLQKELFNAEWFNYLQAGNHDGTLHINVQPRYSSQRELEGFVFKDENWGHLAKLLPDNELAPKDIVLKIVTKVREVIAKNKYPEFTVEISEN
ncbi:MAG: hypothetical protein ABI721_03235 [Candidatus Dojkabacteria bacterium]